MQKHFITNFSTPAPTNSATQRGRILELLIAARGGWVGLPEISALAAQYNRLGFVILNKTQEINGSRRSWFRLASTPVEATSSTATPIVGRNNIADSQIVSPGSSNSLSSDPRDQETLPLFPEGNR